MKAYESASAVAARKRVKKVHAKARWAGVLYTLGALALLAFTVLPILTSGVQTLDIGHFISNIVGFINGETEIAFFIVAVLYVILLLTVFFNFFRCLSKLGWLSNRSSRYVNGYNKNMRAMEQMGERFAQSFGRFVNFYLIAYLVYSADAKVAIEMMAYVALGVCLVIHFIAGLTSGKVSRFNVQGVGGVVEEIKRECGLFVYFFRNLVQIGAIGAILYLFAPNALIGAALQDFALIDLAVIMQALLLLTLFVMIRHATADTEFNRLGIDGKGMKKFVIAAFFATIFAAVAAVMAQEMDMNYIYIAAIAFGTCLIHWIFKTRHKAENTATYPTTWGVPEMSKKQRKREEKRNKKKNAGMPMDAVQSPMMGPACCPNAACCAAQQPMAQQMNKPMSKKETKKLEKAKAKEKKMAKRVTVANPMMMPPVNPTMMPPVNPTMGAVNPAMLPAPANMPQNPGMPGMPMGMPPVMPMPVPVPMPMPMPMPMANGMPQMPAMAKPVAPAVQPQEKAAEKVEEKAEQKQASKPLTKKQAKKQYKKDKKAKKAAKKQAKMDKKAAKSQAEKDKKAAKLTAKENAKKAKKETAAVKKAEKRAAKEKKNQAVKPTATAAVMMQKPAPSPSPRARREEGIFESEEGMNPKKVFQVRCPQCAKTLSVRETSPYHRCPACGKVFSLRKFEKYTLKK